MNGRDCRMDMEIDLLEIDDLSESIGTRQCLLLCFSIGSGLRQGTDVSTDGISAMCRKETGTWALAHSIA